MLPFRHRVTKEIIGCPGPFNACADPVVCNGMGLYLLVRDAGVTEAHWWCGQCIDDERQALELACCLIVGKDMDFVHTLSVEAFAAAGGRVAADLALACTRVLLAVEMALIDHEVKNTLAPSSGQLIDANQRVKHLGFMGREGQRRLKTVLEDQLARYKLRIPSVKAQEWTAFGTAENCSRWVQSALKTALLNEVMERCYPSPA